MAAYVLIRVTAVVLLVAANAFFVAAEYALISVRESRIQQMIETGRKGARTVLKLHQRMDEVLSAVQLGVTLASLALGWIGEATIAGLIRQGLDRVPHAALYAHSVAIILAFALITYLEVVLGELVPKSLSLYRADRIALAVAAPMDVFITISKPFLGLMSRSARAVLRVFGTREIRTAGVHSPEELKFMARNARLSGVMSQVEEELIVRSIELADLTVRQVMVPRPRIFSLAADLPLDQALVRVVEEQHSRVPVYDPQRGPEHIVGLLYSKDLTRWMRLRYTKPPSDPAAAALSRMVVRDIMRDVLVVPETKPLSDILLEFRRRKRHLAVVVDEFGSTSGVITVEDVLEQLVGEIEDEFDVAPPPLPVGATTMVLDGSVPIRDLETQYRLTLPSDQGFETLAGFMLAPFQRLPAAGDACDYHGRRFTVLEMDGRRIAKVLIEIVKPAVVEP